MTVDWTKPIQTECGREAKVVFDEKGAKSGYSRLVVAMPDHDCAECISGWVNDLGRGELTIINVPERVTRYGHVFNDGTVVGVYSSVGVNYDSRRLFAIHIEGEKISAEWVE